MTCRHFGVCGGCSLPGVAYAEQLARKQRQLKEWFPATTVGPLVPSPADSGFRQKVAFVFAPESCGARLVMGHYQAGSRRVVPVQECPVHAARGNRAIGQLQRVERKGAPVRRAPPEGRRFAGH